MSATAGAAPRDDKGSVLRALAGRVGHVLGAASACPAINKARIKGISDRIVDVIKTSAANEEESTAIIETLNSSQSEGARGVASRQTDCATADRELSDLESASAPQGNPAPVQSQLQSGPAQLPSALRGVTNNEIRFGIAAAFSGANKDLGQQMRIGIEAAFRAANDAGGVHGRMLRLIAADDGYEPARTSEAMKQLYDKDQVFGFIGNVGTPTAVVSVPFALERRALFFGAFTAPACCAAIRPIVMSSIIAQAMQRKQMQRCVISSR